MKVRTELINFADGITLNSGDRLENFELMIETYGELNESGSNAILLCHAFSGNHHAAGKNKESEIGWWDEIVGPNKAIDTEKYYVVCCNNLGGCSGSSGPTTINPSSEKPYGKNFPQISVKDWVNSQKMLMDKLGVPYWHLVAGGSLGGMQALEWAISYPNDIKKAGIFAAASNSSTQNIALNEVARESIRKDQNFHDGDYLEHNVIPKSGLKTARMLGHITYLSEELMDSRFGRRFQDEDSKVDQEVDFEVENYLQYKGEKFSESFDANSYILMTKAMDGYVAGQDIGLRDAMKNVKSQLLIVGFYSDWLYPPERGKEIQMAAMDNNINSSYIVLEGAHGHDSFLFSSEEYSKVISKFIES
ncbi:MAG: homoserine O-acetyltransferase [SAR86 cluster bacterium]|uniref:Homoserine O-acetyltransferase n=1 Tax=SAR86 cluster bacterium TaxID=2030880 RepID=A0A520MWA5_9GAMM|nr:MAG: homoserine O-acetyltransferase [SAR86 cluster bacterium]